MRIAVISTPIFRLPVSSYSGLEHLAWITARGLAQKGHRVTLVAPDGSFCPGTDVFSTGPAGQHDEQQAYSQYWKILPDYDCVIDHSWQKHTYSLKAENRLKAPVLGVCHAPVNTMFTVWPPKFGRLPAVKKACPVCISQDQANHFEALFSTPARVCRNGVCLDTYKPLNLPRTNRYLFLARFSTIKGPDLAIHTCKVANTGLDLIGDTRITGEPAYLEQCKRAADGKRIRILGGVSRGETVWWYSRAHGMLHPNMRFREPLGLAPLESQACKTPVIAWKYGAMKETVIHGETGFLVESLEEMVELVKTDAVNTLNRDRCRQWVADNFSLQKMVDRYDELCREAVEMGGW